MKKRLMLFLLLASSAVFADVLPLKSSAMPPDPGRPGDRAPIPTGAPPRSPVDGSDRSPADGGHGSRSSPPAAPGFPPVAPRAPRADAGISVPGPFGIWGQRRYWPWGPPELSGSQGPVVMCRAVPAGASVPGPLPVFGVGAAYGWSRRLRQRIKFCQGNG